MSSAFSRMGAMALLVLVCACSETTDEAGTSMDASPVEDAAADATPLDQAVDAAVMDMGEIDADAPDEAVPDMAVVDSGPPPEIEWVRVPAGEFTMGCSEGDEQCYDGELPTHVVTMPAFELNPREINQTEFEAYFDYNPSFYYDCPDCPVDTITWFEAEDFCEELGGRLPTEAEWEYAARGGTTTRYPCGNDAACLDDIAWYAGNAGGETHPGGTKTPNGFGLYDMLGNVWEWVADCWHDDYTMNPPTDGSAWLGADCSYRVVRGGNWGLDGIGLRVSNRDADFPDTYVLPPPGFRCARDVEE